MGSWVESLILSTWDFKTNIYDKDHMQMKASDIQNIMQLKRQHQGRLDTLSCWLPHSGTSQVRTGQAGSKVGVSFLLPVVMSFRWQCQRDRKLWRKNSASSQQRGFGTSYRNANMLDTSFLTHSSPCKNGGNGLRLNNLRSVNNYIPIGISVLINLLIFSSRGMGSLHWKNKQPSRDE